MKIFITFFSFFLFATSLLADNFSNNTHCNNWYKHYNQSCYHTYPSCSNSCESKCTINSNHCGYATCNDCSYCSDCNNWYKHYNQSCNHVYQSCSSSCEPRCVINSNHCSSCSSCSSNVKCVENCASNERYRCGTKAMVIQDSSEAPRLFRKACDDGDAISCFKLGVMLTNGDSIKQDKKEAKQLFAKACEMKHQCACIAYANLNS